MRWPKEGMPAVDQASRKRRVSAKTRRALGVNAVGVRRVPLEPINNAPVLMAGRGVRHGQVTPPAKNKRIDGLLGRPERL